MFISQLSGKHLMNSTITSVLKDKKIPRMYTKGINLKANILPLHANLHALK